MNSLKNIIVIIAFSLSGNTFSQVLIGGAVGTATDKTSVLLEFANTNNKGVILPYVRAKTTTPTQGSIILDASIPTDARVKFYNGNTAPGSGGWVDISGQGADITNALAIQPTSAQVPEPDEAKTIIGANTTSINDGVIVLESTTRAMVLPTVSDVNNIPTPSPGMMVYVNKAGAKRLAVYNGSKWSFWKP
ncbi:hypothetical protein NZ698_01230 [Chryseobacterium sp. PBS4-4]|uniref:Uncharacterized protein n=1 Tax=Chryseobacterium edaphi TaxID=2976532 RepID=A0ABT2W0P1_9FLAO|nr:hypothetical protein [Chryseobacterium edaphi]MCU7615806.1 hypothetical protein [Chryseobacterium edaphi]